MLYVITVNGRSGRPASGFAAATVGTAIMNPTRTVSNLRMHQSFRKTGDTRTTSECRRSERSVHEAADCALGAGGPAACLGAVAGAFDAVEAAVVELLPAATAVEAHVAPGRP